MPKLSKDFNTTLNFGDTLDVKQQLIAIGYMMGQKGEFAGPARNFVRAGIGAYLAGLSARQRRDYDEILANVRLSVTK